MKWRRSPFTYIAQLDINYSCKPRAGNSSIRWAFSDTRPHRQRDTQPVPEADNGRLKVLNMHDCSSLHWCFIGRSIRGNNNGEMVHRIFRPDRHTLTLIIEFVLLMLGWRFSAVVASFVARTKLLNVEPG